MTTKLTIVGNGNEDKRCFFIFKKEQSFFSFFPRFLIGCGFEDIGIYEDYQEDMPDIESFNNKVEHFKNEDYDLDLLFTQDRIILIVRTDNLKKEKVISSIQKMQK